MRLSFLLMLIFVGFIACTENAKPTYDNPFEETISQATYVGDENCASCHEDLYQSYQSHGMANALYELSADNVIEDFPSPEIYNPSTGNYYQAIREGDKFYQVEYEKDGNGAVINTLKREMNLVIGSGTAARTYLTVHQDYYYEMPLTWYTSGNKWEFSPGYKNGNFRFGREINERCIGCHNAYPESVPFNEGKYTAMPLGISCERCHGPGSLHAEARLESDTFEGEFDKTIVNPKHLPIDLRMDVCQQCHLNGPSSLLKKGEEAFSFRPSRPLSSHIALYLTENNDPNKVKVVAHVTRMKASECYKGSINTSKPMDCVTCHNPHEGSRVQEDNYFNQSCFKCHDTQSVAAIADHTETANCVSCHMPKVEAADAPHASFTDHKIRVIRNDEVVYEEGSKSDAKLISYFKDTDHDVRAPVYEAMAYVVFGDRNANIPVMNKGIEMLEKVLPEYSDYDEAYYLLGFALQKLKRYDEALPFLEKSVSLNPNIPERLNTLAQVYEATNRSTEKIENLYKKALQVQPTLAKVRNNYGRFLETQNRLEEAMQEYQEAVNENSWIEESHYNLGTAYLQKEDIQNAEKELRMSFQLNPKHIKTLNNLGLLLAQSNRETEAKRLFDKALSLEPRNITTLSNLATYYINNKNQTAAIKTLETLVSADPMNIPMAASLAGLYFNTGNVQKARDLAQQVLQYDPQNAIATQILQ